MQVSSSKRGPQPPQQTQHCVTVDRRAVCTMPAQQMYTPRQRSKCDGVPSHFDPPVQHHNIARSISGSGNSADSSAQQGLAAAAAVGAATRSAGRMRALITFLFDFYTLRARRQGASSPLRAESAARSQDVEQQRRLVIAMDWEACTHADPGAAGTVASRQVRLPPPAACRRRCPQSADQPFFLLPCGCAAAYPGATPQQWTMSWAPRTSASRCTLTCWWWGPAQRASLLLSASSRRGAKAVPADGAGEWYDLWPAAA